VVTPLSSARPWLDRYRRAHAIRSRASFRLVGATREADDRRVVVVVPGPSADRGRVAEALAEVERVHAHLDHPRIPKVSASGLAGETPFLELECDAVIDGVDMVRRMAGAPAKIPYAAADGFIVSLREALEAAHAAPRPDTGAPICLGRLSAANVLFSPRGEWFLVGFGRNFPLETESGSLEGSVTPFAAPELLAGAAPSPMGDYVALLLFTRSLAAHVELASAIARMLRGDVRLADLDLLTHIRWFDQHVLSAPPPLRPPMREAIAVSDRLRERLGEHPDPARFAAFVATLLERWEEPPALDEAEPSPPATVVLGPEAMWIAAPEGGRHRLGRSLRRIVAALVARHRAAPGEPLSMWDLLEVGWPGERPALEAGANRVYTALTRLRRMGLRDALERFEDGYRLSPRYEVRSADEAGPSRRGSSTAEDEPSG
jgi:hypothetical protein